jgi:hypothetical protein
MRTYRDLMTTAIKIKIPPHEDPDLLHHFRNFGEDVYRALKGKCSISLEEIDASNSEFVVRDVRASDLGTVSATIKRVINAHRFDGIVTLTRL